MSEQNQNIPESPFKAPEGVEVPNIAKIERQRGDLWEELDGKNWPPGRIKQEQDRLFPLPKTAEQIEAEEVQEISINNAQVAKAGLKKTRRRRPLGPRQLNIADGDKRVESAYPKSDL